MDGEETSRTYGIWGLLAVFTALTVAGVAALLFIGSPNSATISVSSPQTMPDEVTETSVAENSTTAAGEPVMPDGSPVPDGVRQVLTEGGVTSYTFDAPKELAEAHLAAVVAPMGVEIDPDGSSASLTIGCARSSEEVLAQVAVTEGEQTVTFAAIALAPDGGAPCDPAVEPFVLDVPLAAPIDSRQVIVVPPGTVVPDLESA